MLEQHQAPGQEDIASEGSAGLSAALEFRATSHEVVLIDPSIPDYETLLMGIPENAQVHILSSSATLKEIADVLAGYQELDAVHLFSHGSVGSLSLSGEVVNTNGLTLQQETLAIIGESLSDDGDILLYGCNVAKDAEGQAFIDQFAELTGADVAASDDFTGAAKLRGDWELEVSVGSVTADVAISQPTLDSYNSILNTIDNSGKLSQSSLGIDIGQVFTATETGIIEQIHVASNTATTITLYIYDGNGVDIGNHVHSQSVTISDSITAVDDYTFETIDIIDTVNITAENEYTFYFTGAEVDLGYITNDNAVGGGIVDGSPYPTIDLAFKVVQGAGVTNDPPLLTGLPTDISATEDTETHLDLSAASFSDLEGDNLTVTLTVNAGTFTAPVSSGGVTATLASNTQITLAGSAAAINTYLDTASNIKYTGAENANGDDAAILTVSATDGSDSMTPQTVNIDIAAVNDDPAASLPASVTVTEDTENNLDLSSASFSDVDGDNITVTLTVSAGTFSAPADGAGIGSGVTESLVNNTTVTLQGSATDINTYLNAATNIKYTGAQNVNGNNAATITITANDGAGSGDVNLGTINMNITGVNDDPTATLPASVTVTEDTEGNLDLSSASFSDVDGDNITVTLTLSAGTFSAPADGAGVGSGVTESLVNSTTITLQGSVADINTYLNTASNIKYTGAQNASGNGAATITVTANDGAGSGNVNLGTININITAVNDSPVVNADPDNSSGGAAGYETTFAAGSPTGVAVVDTDFSITDIDDTEIAGAVITLTGTRDGASESLTIDGTPATVNGISITYTSANEINLSGSTTIAHYQALIQQIRYQNSENPLDATPGARTISIQVDDGGSANNQSNTVNTTVSVVAAPVVNTGPGVTFTENNTNTPVSVVAATASIFDADSTHLNEMVIDLTNAKTSDSITLNGRDNADVVNGITITYDNAARITLSGNATTAEYLALLKELQFVNTSDNPDTSDRTISIATTDTDSYTGTATTTVSVVASDDPSVISGDKTGSVDEGNVGDSAVTASGSLTITDVDTGDSPWIADQGATNGDNGYGIFALSSGTWTYTLNQSTVQSLNVGDSVTDTITYIASDANEVVITVTINGTNDAAELSSADVSLTETNAPLSTSGTLTNSDIDDANTFVAQSNVPGANGTFSIDTNGNWTYVASSAFDQLNTGDNVSDTFTVTATDGTQTSVKVTISGSNDAAVLSSADVSLTETNAPLTTSGTLTNSDVDSANTFLSQNNVSGTNGTFSIDANGNWNYVANSAFDSLNTGDSVSDTFTVTSIDGTQTSVKVTINGSNDAAVLSSADVSLTETNALLSTSGTLTNSDVDNTNTFQPQNSLAGSYGAFTIDANGNWNYIASSALDNLDAGDIVSDTFTVTASDGSLTQVKVTINGSNDVAVVSGAVSGSVTEGNEGDSPATATGSLIITDADDDDYPGFADQGITGGDNGYGSFELNDGTWTYTLNQAAVSNLDEGDTLTDTITYTATDGTTQLVTVTILGKDESIVVSPVDDNVPDSGEMVYETSSEPGIPDPLTTPDGAALLGLGDGLTVETPTSDVAPGAGSPTEALAGDNGLVTSAQTQASAFAVQGLFNQQNLIDARYGSDLITDSSGQVSVEASLPSLMQVPDVAFEFEAELGEEAEFNNESGQQEESDPQQLPLEGEGLNEEPPEGEELSLSTHDYPVQVFSTQLALAVDGLQMDMQKLDEALMHVVRAEDSETEHS
nr:VCBS domain-containing protein [Salinisphaera sp. G21_0]